MIIISLIIDRVVVSKKLVNKGLYVAFKSKLLV